MAQMFKSKMLIDDFILNEKDTTEINQHLHNFSRKLMCVEYPAVVENVNKMIETLGGMQTFEIAVGTKKKHVELKFRPNDIYCKPCYGDKEKRPGILLRIKIRQPKIIHAVTDAKLISSCEYEVVGVTAMNIRFKRMCDFQYLPFIPEKEVETPDTKLINIHKRLFPERLPDICYLNTEEMKYVPLFFPPSIFSRHSRTINIEYDRFEVFLKSEKPEIADRYKSKGKDKNKLVQDKNIVTCSRKSRTTLTIFVKFEDKCYPTRPLPEINSLDEFNLLEELEIVKKLFSERPIWSKTGLQHRSQIVSSKLKQILSHLAYYTATGPWRIMWVKFGCDPRKDPNMRIYQTFDYRIRSVELKTKVSARGTSRAYSLNADLTNIKKFSLEDHLFDESQVRELPTENHYVLSPGVIPAARQMFYQYCDLHLPEIKAMFERLPDVPPDTECHPKNGWLPEDFANQCREIVNEYILQTVYGERTKTGNDSDSKYGEIIDDEMNIDDVEIIEHRLFDGDSSEEENTNNNQEGNDFQSDENIDEDEISNINNFLEDIIKDSNMKTNQYEHCTDRSPSH